MSISRLFLKQILTTRKIEAKPKNIVAPFCTIKFQKGLSTGSPMSAGIVPILHVCQL
jgi:hypothetical protein